MVDFDKLGTRLMGVVFLIIAVASVYWAFSGVLYGYGINWFALALPLILVPMGLWMLKSGGED